MWLRNKKTGGLFNTDDIKNKYISRLNDASKKEYENKIDKTEYDKEVREATEDYKKEKAINKQRQNDLYQSKVFGTDVTKMDKQMKDLFGEDFKYAEEKEFHYAGEELYSDDPNRFGKTMKDINNKVAKGNADNNPKRMLSEMSTTDLRKVASNWGIDATGLSQKQLMAKIIAIMNNSR